MRARRRMHHSRMRQLVRALDRSPRPRHVRRLHARRARLLRLRRRNVSLVHAVSALLSHRASGTLVSDMSAFPTPRVPHARLTIVENETGFQHFQCMKMGPGRRFCDTVVVKGAFDLTPDILERRGRASIAYADHVWDAAS